jgi:hypothetical protein
LGRIRRDWGGGIGEEGLGMGTAENLFLGFGCRGKGFFALGLLLGA